MQIPDFVKQQLCLRMLLRMLSACAPGIGYLTNPIAYSGQDQDPSNETIADCSLMHTMRHHLPLVNSSVSLHAGHVTSRGGKSGLSNKPIFAQPPCLSKQCEHGEEPEAHTSGAHLLLDVSMPS